MLASYRQITKPCYGLKVRPNVVVIITLLAATLLLHSEQAVLAQTGNFFNSGSSGADGALNLTTPGTIIFDPRSFNPPLDADGDNVYHFTTINIAAGVTVTLRGPQLNMNPVFWLASGDVQINGVIDLSGSAGHPINSANPADRYPSTPGAGGYPGGVARRGTIPAQPGTGPGGGQGATNDRGCGAGHAERGFCVFTPPNGGQVYGNSFLVPFVGGSGGGGGGTYFGNKFQGQGGGAGGGALLIASTTSIRLNGSILAKGGETVQQGSSEDSGGGSGGAIHLMAATIVGTGKLNADGGLRISSNYPMGSPGRIRLDAFQQSFTGQSIPQPVLGSPSGPFLPPYQPTVRVLRVENADVPLVPGSSVQNPDVTVSQALSSTFQIEARYVPLGTVVKLHIFSENGPDQTLNSAPLVGTFERSTTTIVAVIPPGHSRMFVRADWTP